MSKENNSKSVTRFGHWTKFTAFAIAGGDILGNLQIALNTIFFNIPKPYLPLFVGAVPLFVGLLKLSGQMCCEIYNNSNIPAQEKEKLISKRMNDDLEAVINEPEAQETIAAWRRVITWSTIAGVSLLPSLVSAFILALSDNKNLEETAGKIHDTTTALMIPKIVVGYMCSTLISRLLLGANPNPDPVVNFMKNS